MWDDGIGDDIYFEEDEHSTSETPSKVSMLIGQMNLKVNSYNNTDPDITKIIGKDSKLKAVVDSLTAVLSAEGSFELSQLDREDILKCVKVIINQISIAKTPLPMKVPSITKSPFSGIKNENVIQKNEELSKSLTELQDELGRTKELLKQKQSECEYVTSENHDLRELNQDIKNEKQKALSKLGKVKNDYEVQIKNLKEECDRRIDETTQLKDKQVLIQNENQRLIENLEHLNDELSQVKSQYSALKTKFASKTKKLESLEDERLQIASDFKKNKDDKEKILVIANKYRVENDDLKKQISILKSEAATDAKAQIESLSTACDELSDHMEEHFEEISEMSSANNVLQSLVVRLNQLVAEYDQRLFRISEERDKYITEKLNFSKENKILQKKLEMADKKIQALSKYEEEHSIFDEISSMVELEEGETLPEAIQRVISNAQNPELIAMNTRLIAFAQNQLKMTTDLLSKDNSTPIQPTSLDPLMLNPQNDRRILKEQMTAELSRCRAFISANNIGGEEISPESAADVFTKLSTSNSLMDQEVYTLFVAQVKMNSILQKKCDELTEEMEDFDNMMNTMAASINFKGDRRELPAEIVDQFNAMESVLKRVLTVIKKNGAPKPYEEIENYVVDAHRIISVLDRSIRRLVGFNGPIDELPQFVIEYIEGLKNANEEIPEALQSQLSMTTEELSREKENSTMIQNDLQESIQKKDALISQLTKRAEESEREVVQLSQHIQRLEQQKAEMQAANDELAKNFDEAMTQNEQRNEEVMNLRKAAVAKDQEMDRRIDSAIEENNRQADAAIKRSERKAAAAIERVEREKQEKIAKLMKTKEKMRNLVEMYEESQRGMSETIAALKAQNEQFQETISQLNNQLAQPSEASKAEITRLETLCRMTRLEKQNLQMKLRKAQDSANQSMIAAEEMWRTRLDEKEGEIRRRVQDARDEVTKEHNQFLAELQSILNLSDSTPTAPSDEEEIKRALTSLRARYEAISSAVNSRSMENSPRSPAKSASTALREWDKWGRDMILSTCSTISPGLSAKDVRSLLTEMITASASYGSIIKKLDNLRVQKVILTKLDTSIPDEMPPVVSIRPPLVAIVFLTRIAKKYL